MDIEWSSKERAFQEEVRNFFETRLTPEIRASGSLMTSVYSDHEASLAWQKVLVANGWAAPAWPTEYGGCDWTIAQHYIFARERARAGAPPLSPMGIQMCAPALIQFGTPVQKGFTCRAC
jgi:alkylation response protein AidB-like acyl-CoA dehydrogenase